MTHKICIHEIERPESFSHISALHIARIATMDSNTQVKIIAELLYSEQGLSVFDLLNLNIQDIFINLNVNSVPPIGFIKTTKTRLSHYCITLINLHLQCLNKKQGPLLLGRYGRLTLPELWSITNKIRL